MSKYDAFYYLPAQPDPLLDAAGALTLADGWPADEHEQTKRIQHTLRVGFPRAVLLLEAIKAYNEFHDGEVSK